VFRKLLTSVPATAFAAAARRPGSKRMKMQVSMLGGAPRATRSLGGILIESGQLTPEDAERVLQLQKEENLRFGAAAVKLGLLTEADIQYALSRQFSYAYLRKIPARRSRSATNSWRRTSRSARASNNCAPSAAS
jgi:hypothetical protein